VSNSSSSASRTNALHVDIYGRFHQLSGAREAGALAKAYLSAATMPLWPSVFSLSRAVNAASREG
jgi:hypothetical protein